MPLAPIRVSRTSAVAPRGSPELQTQRELSAARIELGRAMLAKKDTAALEATVGALEAREAKQPREEVEKARLTVFLDRYAELESRLGTKEAIRYARNTFYRGELWTRTFGTPEVPMAEVLAAGLPHGSANAEGDGFQGQMRWADGRIFDMGHVLTDLDFFANGDRQKAFLQDPKTKLIVPQPFDEFTGGGIIGDIASALNRKVREGTGAYEALLRENNQDLRGDMYGHILARRMESSRKKNGELPRLAPMLREFFSGSSTPLEHVREFAEGHDNLFDHVSMRDGKLDVNLDTFKVAPKLAFTAAVIGRGDNAFKALLSAKKMIDATELWLEKEAANEHPIGDYARS